MSAAAIWSIYKASLTDYKYFKADQLSYPLFALLVLLPIGARLHTAWLLHNKGKSNWKSNILGFLGGYSYYYYISYPYETKKELLVYSTTESKQCAILSL
ncbi:hypothetical protein BC833DRAFT_610365 [Globomyces pollinis-pini]|nr:hypothetical protein BC833DRAFT_610365 [Globomyces pollinis-pini]